MRRDSASEQLLTFGTSNFRVGHRIAESYTFITHCSRSFSASLLVFASCGGLVRGPVLAVHLVVRELDDHLNIGIRTAFEFLDQTLSISLVCLDAEFMGCYHSAKLLLGGCNIGEDGIVGVKFHHGRIGEG